MNLLCRCGSDDDRCSRRAAAVCLSRVYLGAHFPLDVAAGAGLGMFIGGVLNLVFGVPGNGPRTARASGLP
jgi:membrane-associated phospholipid phosphatase